MGEGVLGMKYEFPGYCPVCEAGSVFTSDYDWFRDHLICPGCRSVVRERALALALSEIVPD